MLLPTNSSSTPVGFQQELYHSVTEKTKFFASKCWNSERMNDTTIRGKLKFCVCTLPRKKDKRSTKWYVKVRLN